MSERTKFVRVDHSNPLDAAMRVDRTSANRPFDGRSTRLWGFEPIARIHSADTL
jgi:hypothetical protein